MNNQKFIINTTINYKEYYGSIMINVYLKNTLILIILVITSSCHSYRGSPYESAIFSDPENELTQNGRIIFHKYYNCVHASNNESPYYLDFINNYINLNRKKELVGQIDKERQANANDRLSRMLYLSEFAIHVLSQTETTALLTIFYNEKINIYCTDIEYPNDIPTREEDINLYACCVSSD